MPGEKPRAVLQFNEYDFRHRKVLEILRERPRNKTELVVNAILHYMSCPEAAEEFNKRLMAALEQSQPLTRGSSSCQRILGI